MFEKSLTHGYETVLGKGRAICFCVSIFLFPQAAESLAEETAIEAENIRKLKVAEIEADEIKIYKQIDGLKLGLHIFYPENHDLNGKTPAVLFFHGGGWGGGKASQFYKQSLFFAKQGLVAASVRYRVRNDDKEKNNPTHCVRDAKSAVRWVRQNADKLGVDPDRIAASGGSAGGHLAVSTGVLEGLEEEGEDLTVSSRPDLIFAFNPVIDTTKDGFEAKYLPGDDRTVISPCHNVQKGIPPTLIMHGTEDKTVPFENVERFTRLMNEAGNVCELEAYEGEEHRFFNNRKFVETVTRSVRFLEQQGFIRTNDQQ